MAFIDPRRSRGLNDLGRRFVLSMMHERVRAADPDYADVGLAIFQLSEGDERARGITLHTDTGAELFSLREMEDMVAWTYALWTEISEEREVEERRRAAGSPGTLL